MLNLVTISTSIGDLIDRITILKLKSKRIKNEMQLKNISFELNLLTSTYNSIKKSLKNFSDIEKLESELMVINATLWDCEDQIRLKTEDVDIVKIAKIIIHANDQRASIKYQINVLLNSHIIEEKSYQILY